MHAVAAFFASIIAFVSGFLAPAVASDSPVDVRATQPAAAAVAQTEIASNPFTDPAAAAVVASTSATAPAPTFSPPPAQTVINQPVIERIIERIVPQGATNISSETLAAILTDFERSISSRIAALNPPKAAIAEQVAAAGNATGAFLPASQRIDQLTNTAINSPTITGGTISNATVSGTLSGTFSGTSSFTAATTSSLAISSIAWGLLSTDGSGNIVATSTPTAAAFIATSTIASRFPYASSTALSVSGTAFFGIATSTNLFAQTASLGTLNIPGITNAIASTNASGQVVATTSIGWNLIKGPASSIFAFDASGNPLATTSIGVNYLTGILPIANGGTATSTQVTNGVNFFDGTRITSGNALTFDGTTLTTPRGVFSSTSGTTTIASGQGFTIGSTQFVLQQGSGYVGIGTTNPTGKLNVVSSVRGGNPVAPNGNANALVVEGASTGIGLSILNDGATNSFTGWIGFGNSTNAIPGYIEYTHGDNLLQFATNGSVRQTINGSGNVGIGTTTPGTLLAVNGTASAQKLTIDGLNYFDAYETYRDASSGLLFNDGKQAAASGYVWRVNNGTEVARITNAGNVGIGTTTPWGKLSITGSGTGTGLAFAVADSANTPHFVIQDNGNVGIGTTTPGSKLTIKSNAAVEFWADNSTNFRIEQTNAGAFGFFGNRNDYFLNFDTSNLRVGIGATTTPWAKLSVQGAGTGTGLAFAVADRANTPRFVIQDNGNVGIGTTSPAYPLDVKNDGVSIVGRLLSANTSATYLSLNNNSTGGHDWWIGSTGSANGMGAGKLAIYDQTAGMPRLLIDGSGNVGIGTTSPTSNLSINGASSAQVGLLASGAGGRDYRLAATDNSNGLGGGKFTIYDQTAGASRITIDSSGNVGIGVTAQPTTQLYVQGASGNDYAVIGLSSKTTGVGVSGFSQNTTNYGYIGYNNNWGIYCVGVQCGGTQAWTNTSDVRLKTAITDIDASSTLAALMRLRPITYHWKDAMIDAGRGEQLGFIAQEVEPLFPDLVAKGASTTITLADGSKETIPDPKALDYSGFVVPLVKAVQEIVHRFDTLATAVSGFAERFTTRNLCVEKSDGSDVCITGDQLAALLAAADQSPTFPVSTAQTSTPQPPIVELNGNASSTIEVGASYSDLGARIVAPDSDLNLGIVIVLDGATTTAVSIDTSTPGEHTILYTVTSPTTSLTGSVMRSIIIFPAEQPAEPPANDNPFNAAPANDNAAAAAADSAATGT